VTGTTGTNGVGTSPTPTGTVANAGARPQPPFVPGAATNAGTGKGDVPSGTTANGSTFVNNGNTTTTGGSNVGGAGSPNTIPSNTAAPRIVNGITIPASGSSTSTGASGAGGTTTPSGTTLATGSPSPTGAGLPTGTTPTGFNGTGVGGTGVSGTGFNGTGSSTVPATTPSTSSATTERVHVIASGDTFEALAQKYFNDSTKWQLIAKANPTVEPERLKIGQKVRIPSGATTATLAAETNAPTVSNGTRGSTGSSGVGGNFHTVAKGDTPSSISRKYYGSDKYWRQILAANKGATEKNLKVGQKLTIPAKDMVVGAENVGGRGS
jgi:nucleoid-associated protein YgaU